MDDPTFQGIINKYGEANVLSMACNNASKAYFNGQFTLAGNYNSTTGNISVVEKDVTGNEYLYVFRMDWVQSIIFAISDSNLSQVETQFPSITPIPKTNTSQIDTRYIVG